MPNAVWELIAARERRRPADPVVTYLSHDGSRTELSGRTLANNVAKSANALRDEALLDPGSRLGLHVPWHWQRAVWALAAWCVGVDVAPDASGDLTLIEPNGAVDGHEVWAVSLHPFGLPNADVPEGAQDAATIVRLQPDAFVPGDIPRTAAALRMGGTTLSIEQAIGAAQDIAQTHDLTARDRVIVSASHDLDSWLWCTLVPLVADASVVLVDDGVDVDALIRSEGARRTRP